MDSSEESESTDNVQDHDLLEELEDGTLHYVCPEESYESSMTTLCAEARDNNCFCTVSPEDFSIDVFLKTDELRQCFLTSGLADILSFEKYITVSGYTEHNKDWMKIQYPIEKCPSIWGQFVLPHVLEKNHWDYVSLLLQTTDINETLRRDAVKKAMTAEPTETNKQHLAEILLKCSDDQLPDVLACLVKWQMWSAVNTVLEQRTEEVCKQADKFDLVAIVHNSTAISGDSVLKVLVNQQKWMTVFDILQRKPVSADVLKWVLKEACGKATTWELCFYVTLLPRNAEIQTVSVLYRKRQWEALGKLLKHCASSTFSRIIKKALEKTSDHEFEDYFLDACPEDQFLDLLPLLAKAEKWCSLRGLLHKIVVCSLNAWALSSEDLQPDNDLIFKAVKQGMHVDVSGVYMHICSRDARQYKHVCALPWKVALSQVLCVSLTHIFCSALCSGTSGILSHGNSTSKTISALYKKIESCIDLCLPVCKVKLEDKYTTNREVIFCQQLDMCILFLNKRVAEFSKEAQSFNRQPFLALHFLRGLHHYTTSRAMRQVGLCDNLLLTILALLPTFPEIQSEALKMSVNKKRFAVLQHACFSYFTQSTENSISSVAGDKATKNKKKPKKKKKKKKQKWSPPKQPTDLKDNPQNCSVDSSVTTLLTVGEDQPWDAMLLCTMKSTSYDDEALAPSSSMFEKWADENEHENINIKYSQASRSKFYTDEVSDFLDMERCETTAGDIKDLTDAVKLRDWEEVIELCRYYIYPDEAMMWSWMELCMNASEDTVTEAVDLFMGISAHITFQLLEVFAARGFWNVVADVIHHDGIPCHQRRLVFQKAFECTDFAPLFRCGVEFCPQELGDFVLPYVMRYKCWNYVSMLLEKTKISDELRRKVVDEVMEGEARDSELLVELVLASIIFPHHASLEQLALHLNSTFLSDKECFAKIASKCLDDQLDTVLKKSVDRQMWQAVSEMFVKRNISPTLRKLKLCAIKKVCRQANDHDLTYIMKLCASQTELDLALKLLVKRQKWMAVSNILETRNLADSLQLFAIKKASKRAADEKLSCILQVRSLESQIKSVLRVLVHGKRWPHVENILKQTTNLDSQKWVISKATDQASDLDFQEHIFSACRKDQFLWLIPSLAGSGKWRSLRTLIHKIVIDTLQLWAAADANGVNEDLLFTAVKQGLHVDVSPLFNEENSGYVYMLAAVDQPMHLTELLETWPYSADLSEVLYSSLVGIFSKALRAGTVWPLESVEKAEQLASVAIDHIKLCMKDFEGTCISPSDSFDAIVVSVLDKQKTSFTNLAVSIRQEPLVILPFLRSLLDCSIFKEIQTSNNILLNIFTILPLFPELQDVSLGIMLRNKKWGILGQSVLSHAWDNTRRRMFRAAVEQKQWTVVKAWIDHNLHDDLRTFAIDEAFRDKQWEAMLLLTDHGLDMGQLMRVHYRIAKYANWNVVLQMLERGGDGTEMKDLIQMNITEGRRATSLTVAQKRRYTIRCERLTRLEKKLKSLATLSWKKALEKGLWGVVLFKVNRRGASDRYINLAIDTAIEKKAWHVVVQLVKVGMSASKRNASKRNELFPAMVKDGRWTVCRALLDRGVSLDLCLQQLPVLMENHQWLLVAVCMEYDVGDDLREQVMQEALTQREGSVVWQCIRTMHRQLSIAEREQIFQQAMAENIWQAVKPLIEWSDCLGIQQRDTAMLAAIEQHMWDVVDRCQWHGANIDMTNGFGETSLHTAAKRKDWIAVEALVERDADPNLLDDEGYSVVNRAILDSQNHTVKVLIEYHADIHLPAGSDYDARNRMAHHAFIEHFTPLQLLITARQGKLLDLSLLWCPDQGKGVNGKGETTLHAACLSGEWKTLYYQIARGVSPLSLTLDGQSALFYAVQNTKHPQKMVAECIRLGISTHQPSLSGSWWMNTSLLKIVVHNVFRGVRSIHDMIRSPILLALLKGVKPVFHMLYESGSCSQAELFFLHKHLQRLIDPECIESQMLNAAQANTDEKYMFMCQALHGRVIMNITTAQPALKQMATTPRSLKSSCRLVISHCLPLRRKRHLYVEGLTKLSSNMKNYVLFTDLTDPCFGKDMEWPGKSCGCCMIPFLPLPPVPPLTFYYADDEYEKEMREMFGQPRMEDYPIDMVERGRAAFDSVNKSMDRLFSGMTLSAKLNRSATQEAINTF